MSNDFLRAVVLKVAFKPEPLRQAQAALIYVALSGVEFTADVLPREIVGDDTKLPGCAVGSLSRIGLIESTGFVRSPSETRHGAFVQRWRLAAGKRATAEAWLRRNGFSSIQITNHQAEMFQNN